MVRRDWFSGKPSPPRRRPTLSEMIAAKQYSRAIEVLRAQFRGRVPTTQMRLQLADLLFLAGRREEATPVLLDLADELAGDGFVAKAVAVLKRIEKVEPGRADVEVRLASLVQRPGANPTRSSTVPAIPSMDAAIRAQAASPPPPAFGMEELSAETLNRIKTTSALRSVSPGTPWETDGPAVAELPAVTAPATEPPPAMERPVPPPAVVPAVPAAPPAEDSVLASLADLPPAAETSPAPPVAAPPPGDPLDVLELGPVVAAPDTVGDVTLKDPPPVPAAIDPATAAPATAEPGIVPRGMGSVLKRLFKALPLGLGRDDDPASPVGSTPADPPPATSGDAAAGADVPKAETAPPTDAVAGEIVQVEAQPAWLVAEALPEIAPEPPADVQADVAAVASPVSTEPPIALPPPPVVEEPSEPPASPPEAASTADVPGPAAATEASAVDAPPPAAAVAVEATPAPAETPSPEVAALLGDGAGMPPAPMAQSPTPAPAPPRDATDAAASMIAERLGGAFKRFLADLVPGAAAESAPPAPEPPSSPEPPASASAPAPGPTEAPAPEPPAAPEPPPPATPEPADAAPAAAVASPPAAPGQTSEEIDLREVSSLLNDLDVESPDELFPEVFVDDDIPTRREEPPEEPLLSLGETASPPMSEEKFQGQVLDLIQEVLHQPAPAVLPGEPGPPGYRDEILSHPLFRDLSEAELLAVVRAMQHHSFEPGQIVVTEGEAGGSLFVLITGSVKLFVKDPAGRNVTVGELTEGAFFGEMSVLSGKPRTATITATAECELLELDKKTLDGIAYAHPRVRDILDAIYVQRASNMEAAAVRAAPVLDDGMRRQADEVLRAYFGDRDFDPRMQLKLASVLLKAGKEAEAIPVLVELADDLVRSGHPAKAIAILKKIERLRTRDMEVVSLAPLMRPEPNPDITLPPAGRPGPPRPGTSLFFRDWLVDAVRRTVKPEGAAVPGLRPEVGTSPLLQDLTEDELMTVMRDVRLRTFEPGDVVLTEGEAGSSLFLLTAGAVRVFVKDPAGRSVEVAQLRDGSFFGEMAALSGRPRNATVTAAARCEALELEKGTLDALVGAHPKVRTVLEESSTERSISPEATRARRGASAGA